MQTNVKLFPFLILLTIIITAAGITGVLSLLQHAHQTLQTSTVAVHPINADIVASGTIHSTQEATLHFQTGGKLTYLPFKEGDIVSQGQTIAQLDTYTLQQQLTQALNTYKSTRDTFDQTQANSQTGVLQNGQKSALNPYNQSSLGGDQQFNAINDAAKRIIDQNQASLDNAVINVQIANDALQLATLTAPFSGIITSEDVTVPNQIITTATSFSLADLTSLVFRANVAATDIDFVTDDAQATIAIANQQIHGVVIKIYPQKITLPTGESVYQVDITSPSLTPTIKLGQTGVVHIATGSATAYTTVPTWVIVGHNHIWVMENNKPVLKTITINKEYGNVTSISGLTPEDRIITNPSSIAAEKYSIL